MKTILTFILTCFLSISAICQTTSDTSIYPRFYVVNGDTIGIILTIEQVQKIDNDLEIKYLLEQSLVDCDSLSSQYIIVVNKLEERVVILELKITELKLMVVKQDKVILELKNKISNLESDLKLCEIQAGKKDEIIKNQKKTINKLIFTGSIINLTFLVIIGALIF